jgi:hypothetical protein
MSKPRVSLVVQDTFVGLGLVLTFWVLFLALMAVLGGCALTQPITGAAYAPHEAIVVSPHRPDVTYDKASRVFAQRSGWVITRSDPSRSFNGLVHNAAHLTVLLEPQEKGTIVTIHGTVLPSKQVQGTFDEVEEYAKRLREAL